MNTASGTTRARSGFWPPIGVAIVAIFSLFVAYGPELRFEPLRPGLLNLPDAWQLPVVVTCGWVIVVAAMAGLGGAKNRLRYLLLFAFGLRVILGLWHFRVFWPDGFFNYRTGLNYFDAFLYVDLADRLSAQGLTAEGLWNGLNYQGIAYYYAIQFYVFGSNAAIGVVVNCVLAAITPVLLYRFLLLVTREPSAEGAAAALAVLPESLLWSSIPMKESVITFTLVAGLLAATVAYRTRSWRAIFFAVVSVALLVQLRIAGALILIGSIAVATAIMYRHRLLSLAVYGIVALALIATVMSLSNNQLIRSMGNPLTPTFYLRYAEVFRERPAELNAQDPGSSLGIMTSGGLTEGKVYWIPVRSAMFYLNPTPLTRGMGSFDPFRMASAALVWFSLPAAFFGLLQLWKRASVSAPLWVTWLFGTILISSSTPFIDDRLRMMVMPLYLGVVATGFSSLRQWWPVYAMVPPVAAAAGLLFYLYKLGG